MLKKIKHYEMADNLDVKKLDSCYKYGYESVINNLEEIKEKIK